MQELPLFTQLPIEGDVIESSAIPTMQIMRYMGNKRALLLWLLKEINKYLEPGDTVLDLFAGTSSVGYGLKPKARIIANDIQEYSKTISCALLCFNDSIPSDDFDKYLMVNYKKNYRKLIKLYGKALEVETQLLNSSSDDYFSLIQKIPIYCGKHLEDPFNLSHLTNEMYIKRKRNSKKSFPYILFSTYFSNTFFSIKQCVEIDSLRYSIDQIGNINKKSVYLSSLIYAISKAVNSSGHFAEYINPHSSSSKRLIRNHRKISVIDSFHKKLTDFKYVYKQERWMNKVYSKDYKDLILLLNKNREMDNVKIIYIDPPYTTAQYSRYYHIPETLVKYDYPQIEIDKIKKNYVKGRYRNDRHQSSFSKVTETENAFRDMFHLLAENSNAILAISYSDNSIIRPIDRLIDIASQYYNVTNVKNGYSHSAQGSKFTASGKGSHQIHEYLLICKPKL